MVYLAVLAALVLAAAVAAAGGARAETWPGWRSLSRCCGRCRRCSWAFGDSGAALTYRVGVRLFISYLLIGLTPIALAACLAFVVGYAAGRPVRRGARPRRDGASWSSALARRADAAAAELAAGRPERAREAVERSGQRSTGRTWSGCSTPPPAAGAARAPPPAGSALGHRGGVAGRGASTARPAYLAAVARRGDTVAAVLLPLDLANARAFGRGRWYEVRFVAGAQATGPKGGTVTVTSAAAKAADGHRQRPQRVPRPRSSQGWLSARPREGTRWQRIRFFWMWVAEDAEGTRRAVPNSRARSSWP